ncbi:MAG: hypothetical protein NWE95_04555 [Candidatus Bathyarchaeota archaeon]|nr:hypothetical protein [Candidatus Bathyarchaeota archaeon]
MVREIPIDEIGSVESYWNELSITWNGVTNIFFKKNSFESFSELRDKVRLLIDENQKVLQEKEASRLRGVELAMMVGAVLPVVDAVFDVLRGLHVKKIDWSPIEAQWSPVGKSWNFETQNLHPLSLDLSLMSDSIALQSSKKVAKEGFVVLKLIRGYFDGLKVADDFSDVHPNFKDAMALVDAYFALNDVFLGKIVGDKNVVKECGFLEGLLQKLGDETNFKVNFEELNACVGRLDVGVDVEGVVGEVRAIFKEQLSQMVA